MYKQESLPSFPLLLHSLLRHIWFKMHIHVSSFPWHLSAFVGTSPSSWAFTEFSQSSNWFPEWVFTAPFFAPNKLLWLAYSPEKEQVLESQYRATGDLHPSAQHCPLVLQKQIVMFLKWCQSVSLLTLHQLAFEF